MNLYELNPFIRFAKKIYTLLPTNETSICYDCRLFFISKASGSVIINKTKYSLLKNTAIFLPAGSHYKFIFDHWNDLEIIIFDFDLTSRRSKYKKSFGTATEKDFNPDMLCTCEHFEELNREIIIYDFAHIEQNLIKCCEEFLTESNHYREYTSALLKICLVQLVRKLTITETNNPIVYSVMNYIYNNYQNPDLNNEIIARHFNYHPNYLNSLIKNSTKKTLHQNILSYRVHIAKNMLITSRTTITDIAWKVGFNSTNNFISVFRNHTGMTPHQYRKKNIIMYV